MKTILKTAVLAMLGLSMLGTIAHASPEFDLIYHSGESPDIGKVKAALDKKVKVDHHDYKGMTALLNAAWYGHIEIAKLLLERGAAINQKKIPQDADKPDGRTPLIMAIQNNRLEMVKFLVERKARVDLADTQKQAPLIWAGLKSSDEVIVYLLEHGAQPGSVDKDGWTPLISAAYSGKLEAVKLLLTKVSPMNLKAVSKTGYSALHMAAFKGHLPVVRLLVEKGLPADGSFRPNMRTPLIAACDGGSLEVVEFLVAQGANINHVSKDQWTPLKMAVAGDKLPVVRYLIGKGVDLDYVNDDGFNAVLSAANRGYSEVLKELLVAGGRALRTKL